jgi:hypothetical protein
MAKVSKPLYSLAASGSMGGATFCTANSTDTFLHVARKKPRATTIKKSAPQLLHQQRWTEAAATWRGASLPEQAFWNLKFPPKAGSGRNWFFLEFILQRCVVGTLPLHPAS